MRNQKSRARVSAQEIKRRTTTSRKSETDHLRDLLVEFMRDTSDMLGVPLERDIQTINERFYGEGFSFISKTLPMFNDWLRSCLASDLFSPCSSFKTYKKEHDGCIVRYPFPAFLRGLVGELANDDGTIKTCTPENRDRQTEILKSITMICTSFGKKYEIPLSKDKVDKQILDWFQDDDSVFRTVSLSPELLDDTLFCQTIANARYSLECLFTPYTINGVNADGVWGPILQTLNFDALKPSHGSGATSFGLANNEKYTRLLGFPIHYMGPDSYSQLLGLPDQDAEPALWIPEKKEDMERLTSWVKGGISKVAVVPKNSSKGRIICMEPAENMLVQQAYRKGLYDWVESHPATAGFVNFRDQSINRALAITASRSGFRATMDLRAASDSVSRDMVRLLFPDHVYLRLDSCRSKLARASINIFEKGKVVGKKSIQRVLLKYAPMGSALSFPVEALCFWALAKGALKALGSDDTCVWVYGDDIILPAEYASSVGKIFKQFNLTVNTEKTFSTGFFRESCGADAYKGMDISVDVRCSTRLPGFGTKRSKNKDTISSTAASIAAWVEYANRFEANGYPRVSLRIQRILAELWPSTRSYPRLSTLYDGGFLYFLSFADGHPVASLGKRERKVGKTMGEYNFTPHFPNPPPGHWVTTQQDGNGSSVQGELFTWRPNPPFYQGKRFKGWMLENGPESVPISENQRYLRRKMEGASESRSDQFAFKENLVLRFKGVHLS